jgi:hypothetical protein
MLLPLLCHHRYHTTLSYAPHLPTMPSQIIQYVRTSTAAAHSLCLPCQKYAAKSAVNPPTPTHHSNTAALNISAKHYAISSIAIGHNTNVHRHKTWARLSSHQHHQQAACRCMLPRAMVQSCKQQLRRQLLQQNPPPTPSAIAGRQ